MILFHYLHSWLWKYSEYWSIWVLSISFPTEDIWASSASAGVEVARIDAIMLAAAAFRAAWGKPQLKWGISQASKAACNIWNESWSAAGRYARSCKQSYEVISQLSFYQHNQVQHSSYLRHSSQRYMKSSVDLDSQENVSCAPAYVLGTSPQSTGCY